MRITRLYLRNYRTFEDPVELELPGGLVGVYGPQRCGQVGAGREPSPSPSTDGAARPRTRSAPRAWAPSAWSRWSSSTRTTSISCGARSPESNHTIKAEAHCDRLQVAEGARDTTRYVHSVLGMDDAAFRASVFAEQKQLAAFSEQSPAERRRLVLQLLGITPLEQASDRARRDARMADDQLQRLRQMLPDLDQLRAGLAEAEAAADAADRGGSRG